MHVMFHKLKHTLQRTATDCSSHQVFIELWWTANTQNQSTIYPQSISTVVLRNLEAW